MSFQDQVRKTVSSVAEETKKQAKRAQLEVRANRLESGIRREKTIIGEALHPQLASGELPCDLAEVQAALGRIEEMEGQLAETESSIEALLGPGTGEDARLGQEAGEDARDG